MDLPETMEAEIKARAKSLGFSLVGIALPSPAQSNNRYLDWIDKKLYAGMEYLKSPYHINSRSDPRSLFPELRSIIVLGFPYSLSCSPSPVEPQGLIAGYAAGDDYHDQIPEITAPLLSFLIQAFPEAPQPRIFTDSAPILERELAVRAGLGWIGRNSCVISPQCGSGFLLAEIFTGITLIPDNEFSADRCGSCTRCMDACPTHCIQPDRTLDASRCISYHTIENRGIIPREISKLLGDWIFGCDICQHVCPWNQQHLKQDFNDSYVYSMSIEQMLAILEFSMEEFTSRFGATAIARARFTGLLRNILHWFGNHQEKLAIPALKRLLNLSHEPVLQHTARQVLRQLEQ